MITSNNWFFFWVGIEINTLTFIILLISQFNNINKENRIVYLIIQAMTSLIILLLIISHTTINMINFISITFIVILITKIGISPFHNWFVFTTLKTKNLIFWILLTIQKLPYFFCFYFLYRLRPLFFMIIFLNLFIRRLTNLKQNILKIILIFSSIAQIRWVLISLSNNSTWQFIIIIYSILMIVIAWRIETSKNQNQSFLLIRIILISLRGFPPLILFFPKILILINILQNKLTILIFIFILINFIDIFVYNRYIFYILLKKIPLNKWKKNLK